MNIIGVVVPSLLMTPFIWIPSYSIENKIILTGIEVIALVVRYFATKAENGGILTLDNYELREFVSIMLRTLVRVVFLWYSYTNGLYVPFVLAVIYAGFNVYEIIS